MLARLSSLAQELALTRIGKSGQLRPPSPMAVNSLESIQAVRKRKADFQQEWIPG